MQSIDTGPPNEENSAGKGPTVIVGKAASLPPGTCLRFTLPSGEELAIYNVNGEYYATDNSCPHRGAPLSEGPLCGHVVECFWHGWQFDVRSGECLTVKETLKTYEVREREGLLEVTLGE